MSKKLRFALQRFASVTPTMEGHTIKVIFEDELGDDSDATFVYNAANKYFSETSHSGPYITAARAQISNNNIVIEIDDYNGYFSHPNHIDTITLDTANNNWSLAKGSNTYETSDYRFAFNGTTISYDNNNTFSSNFSALIYDYTITINDKTYSVGFDSSGNLTSVNGTALDNGKVTLDGKTYTFSGTTSSITYNEVVTSEWTVDNGVAKYTSAGTVLVEISGLKNPTATDGAISGLTADETAKTVTVASELLGDSDVTITNSSDYTLKTGTGVTAPQTTAAAWKIDATTATYNSASNTAGYTLSDDSKTIKYTAAVTGSALVSISGIGDTSQLTINTETKVVTVGVAALASGVTTVSVTSGDYTLARGDGMSSVTTTAAGWTLSDTTATYKDTGKTEGYTLASDGKSITHSSAVEGNTLVTVKGIGDTSKLTINTETKVVTVGVAALASGVTTVSVTSGDYTLARGDGMSAVTPTAAGWTLANTTATYKDEGKTEGYTVSGDAKSINYSSAVEGNTLVTVTGVKSVAGLTLENTTVTVGTASLNETNVTISDGYNLALAEGISAPTYTSEGFTTVSGNSSTYKTANNTAGYTLADNKVTYTAAVAATNLFTLTGIKSTDGIKVADSTVTLTSANLNETNVTISNSDYKLALDNVAEPTYTEAGFTTVSGNSSTYKTANNTAGYTLANNAITYTAAVAANNLVTVSNINSTDGLTFDSTTNVLTIANNFADVATVTNNTANEITVTNGSYSAPLAASKSLIAGANWSYQNSTLYIGGSTLTNVGSITNSTTGISLSDGTLTLPDGVTINPSDVDNPSEVTGSSITSVIVDGIPYNVEENKLVLAVTDFDVRKIEFDGTTITLFNVDGQKIPESKIKKSDYATASDGVLTLQNLGKSSNITVSNTGSEIFKVTDSNFIAGLSSGGAITGVGGSLTGSNSWLYSGTTLSSSAVTLTEVEGITTASGVSISGDSVTLEGTGISYNGTTLSSGSMVATSSDVTLNDGVVATLSSGSSVKFADGATVTLNKLEILSTKDGTSTQTSTYMTLGGNVTYGGLTLTSGTMNVADGITLNNDAVATGNSSTAEINLNIENSATVNGCEIASTDTTITAIYDTGIKFTPNEGKVTYNGMTFSGRTVEINSSGVTLSNGAIVTNAADKNFVVNTAATVTIDGKTFTATEKSSVTLTSTSNGFKIGDESFEVNGDADYTVAAAENDIQILSGISSDATVTTANATLNVVTDSAGKFTIDDRTVTISGDDSVIFGVEDDTVKTLSSLEGSVIGNFNNPLMIDDGRVEILGDENISVTAAEKDVTRIEGVGAENGVTVASAGGASLISADRNGVFKFGTSQIFNVTDNDNAVTFTTSSIDSLNTPSVTGISEVENGVIVLNTDGALTVNSERVTISGIESDVTLTTADGTINGVEGLNGLINGLSGNATVGIIDGDVTINSSAIQISEVDGTTLSAYLDSGKLSEIHGLNNLATVTTAKNVSVETAEQGTFNFPNGTYQISGDNSVVFETDGNSNVVGIHEFAGTLASNQNNVTINGSEFYTSNTDVSIISAGVGIGTISGLASSDTVTVTTDTAVIMPTESVLNINGASYNLSGDDDGIIIRGNNIGVLAADARLTVGAANSYVVNGVTLNARVGDIIIGDQEGTAHIYSPSDITIDENTSTEDVVKQVTGTTKNDEQGKYFTLTEEETKSLVDGTSEGTVSGLDGNFEFQLNNTNTETSTTQTVDFSKNNGIKKVTLKAGNQAISFNDEGGNIAIVSSDATGDKEINLGNGGDVAIIEKTDLSVKVKAGRGKDQIISSADNITVDLSEGGATKVTSTRGTVQLNGYDYLTGAGIQTTYSNITSAIRSSIINFGNGKVSTSNALFTFDPNADSEGSNVVNFFNLKGEKTKVAYTYSDGGTIDATNELENMLLLGNHNSSKRNSSRLMAGSGNDIAFGGEGDYFDLGAGNNRVYLNSNRDNGSSGGATVAMTATEGITEVNGFNSGFGENSDKISINVTDANVSFKDGKLTFSRGNASLILDLDGSLADLIADDNFIGESADLSDITPITYEQGDYQNVYNLGNVRDTLSASTEITFTGA